MDADKTIAESRAEIAAMLQGWDTIPAFLCDRHFTVLASNAMASALSPGFVEGTNLARFVFLEARINRNHGMYDVAADQVAAMLRESLDEHEGDSQFRRIVGELAAKSADFSTAWADESLSAKSRDSMVFDDTPVGPVRVHYQVLRVPGNAEDSLIVWGPADEDSRLRLRRLTATPADD